uniref:Uncharacterized protein n=1 Tax=Manihot esculenta TaxID=3983 RepID=A0A2C9W2W9_MANES
MMMSCSELIYCRSCMIHNFKFVIPFFLLLRTEKIQTQTPKFYSCRDYSNTTALILLVT